MPSITNPTFTLTESNSQVRMKVEYDVTFSGVERQLTTLGLKYHTHVTVHGVDGSTVESSLEETEFDRHVIEGVTAGDSEQTIEGIVERHTVGRNRLQEDPVGEPDELVCNIRIHSPLPPQFTEDVFTPQRVLTSS